MNEEPYHNAPDNDKAMARAIRSRFIELKQQHLGLMKPYKLPERHNNMTFFLKAAVLCRELKATPADYVKACFEMCGNPTALQPNMIYSEKVRGWWKHYENTYKDIISAPVQEDVVKFMDKDKSIKTVEVYNVDRAVTHMVTDQWEMVKAAMGRTPEAGDEETRNLMMDFTIPLAPWFRIFVYPSDPSIWREYSYPGKRFLGLQPDLYNHLRHINPVAVQLIDQQPAAPKPQWLQYDDSYDG